MIRALVLLLAVVAGSAVAQDDRELQVNTSTTGDQLAPRIEALLDARFLVVWQDADAPPGDTDDDGSRIAGRFLDAAGVPSGAAFQVNTTTTGDQLTPRLARTTDGSLVVVWTGEQLAFRRFSAGGVVIGDDVTIPPIQTPGVVDVAAGTDGGFLVVWDCAPLCLGSSGSAIVAQRFDSSGNPASVAQRVHDSTTDDHVKPRVASLGIDGFVVSWTVDKGLIDVHQVRTRRLDRFGAPFGAELVLRAPFGGGSVAQASNGADRYATISHKVPGAQSPIEVHWFDAADAMLGADVLGPSIFDTSAQMSSGGTLDVVFVDGADLGLVRYDAARQRVEEHRQLASTGGRQSRPASADNGTVRIVVWDSERSHGDDGSGRSIQARERFDVVFTDGFESADALRWADRIGLVR
ncbi:MAG: hypothetical protein AAGE94_02725 [Acidobacteriota bacterium]